MTNQDARPRLEQFLARTFIERHPQAAADRFEQLDIGACLEMAETLADRPAALLFGRLSPDRATELLERLSPTVSARLLQAIDPQRAAALLAALAESKRAAILDGMDVRVAKELRELAGYPPESAGSLMDPVVLALHPQATVEQALRQLRRYRDRKVHRVYVVDADGILIGSVSLRRLATSDPVSTLSDIVTAEPVAVRAMAGREELVELWTQLKQASLAVVDFEGRLVGVVRNDRLIDATQAEATVDLQSMVGAGRQERALSKVSFAVRKRLPWLEVNLATAFLAAAVVGIFESTIARFTALAVLLPVVAGQSGNTGAQALAVTMRGLALREIRVRQWARVCVKEVNVAFLNGIAVALTTAAAVYVWSRSWGLALVICVSMILSMIAAGLSGAAIPLLLTATGQDPAQSSSIILTTVTDVTGFLSFLGIATLLAGMI
jgi:magnesium transporter